MQQRAKVLFTIGVMALASAAQAQVKMEGRFVATKACPAVQSIKTGNNAGNIVVKAGEAYQLLGKNNATASYYWITVPGAVPEQRWVAVACGNVDEGAATAAAGSSGSEAPATTPHISSPSAPLSPSATSQPKGAAPRVNNGKAAQNFYVLALSWQPAFCEFLPGKPECRQMTGASYSARNLSLHGLWPQPMRNVYCNVSEDDKASDEARDWRDLPKPQVSAATWNALSQVMPGTLSQLERHEWIKHGTCYPGGSAETYFSDAVRLMQEINASPVKTLLGSRVGKKVSSADIRAAFDQGFGAGAGQRARIACKTDGNRLIISEITLGLKGDISSGTSLANLLQAAAPTEAGCPAGIVDAAGLQ